MSNTENWYGTGRRKTSTARVWMSLGTGNITVNKQPLEKYFGRDVLKMVLRQPLKDTHYDSKVDIKINVKGGGHAGQAGAIRHGIARALLSMSEDLRPLLKKEGYLTRDSREVERKKYGQPKARKKFQFSKR